MKAVHAASDGQPEEGVVVDVQLYAGREEPRVRFDGGLTLWIDGDFTLVDALVHAAPMVVIPEDAIMVAADDDDDAVAVDGLLHPVPVLEVEPEPSAPMAPEPPTMALPCHPFPIPPEFLSASPPTAAVQGGEPAGDPPARARLARARSEQGARSERKAFENDCSAFGAAIQSTGCARGRASHPKPPPPPTPPTPPPTASASRKRPASGKAVAKVVVGGVGAVRWRSQCGCVVVWCGVVWYGMGWVGLVGIGVVWCGAVRFGAARRGVSCG